MKQPDVLDLWGCSYLRAPGHYTQRANGARRPDSGQLSNHAALERMGYAPSQSVSRPKAPSSIVGFSATRSLA